jgi:hypothetical protein
MTLSTWWMAHTSNVTKEGEMTCFYPPTHLTSAHASCSEGKIALNELLPTIRKPRRSQLCSVAGMMQTLLLQWL